MGALGGLLGRLGSLAGRGEGPKGSVLAILDTLGALLGSLGAIELPSLPPGERVCMSKRGVRRTLLALKRPLGDINAREGGELHYWGLLC